MLSNDTINKNTKIKDVEAGLNLPEGTIRDAEGNYNGEKTVEDFREDVKNRREVYP